MPYGYRTDVKTSRDQLDLLYVSVKDYGAVGDGVTDDTAAFTAAQAASTHVSVPSGSYVLDNFRMANKARFECEGYENTIIIQGSAGNPAINCTSDVTTGQISSAAFLNFKVVGHASPTVAAVLIQAVTPYAVWKSEFDFVGSLTYSPLEVQGIAANEIFECDIKVRSQDQLSHVIVNGGTFNNYDMFLTNCNSGVSIVSTDQICNYDITSDGAMRFSGQNSVIRPTVEELSGTTLIGTGNETAIWLQGFSQVLINPIVILTGASVAKATNAFTAFSDSTFINPRVTAAITHPFEISSFPFTIVGGASAATNKMEVIWLGASAADDLRNVTFTGDCSTYTDSVTTHGGKVPQHLAPTTNFNLKILNNTDAMLLEPTGTIAVGNINLPAAAVARNGQTVSISSTQTVTTLNWASTGADISLVPATILANTTFSVVYRTSNTKWYLVT